MQRLASPRRKVSSPHVSDRSTSDPPCPYCKVLEKRVSLLQKETRELHKMHIDTVTRQPDYQADLMTEAARLKTAIDKSRDLEEKLKRRNDRLKEMTQAMVLVEERNQKLEAKLASFAPLKAEVLAHRSEVKSCKKHAEKETLKSEELKQEATQLKLDLAHAQKLAEGVHWEPIGAAKKAQLEQERNELHESVETLTSENRKLTADNAKLAESLGHFRQRERVHAQQVSKLEASAAHAKLSCVEARDAGRKEAAELVESARSETAKVNAALTKTARLLEKARADAEKYKAESEQCRKAYPNSAIMDSSAKTARENAGFAEAEQRKAERVAEQAVAKAQGLEEALSIESARFGAEKWRVECALHAKAKAEEARAKTLLLLEAAEQAANRARESAKAQAKVDGNRVREEAGPSPRQPLITNPIDISTAIEQGNNASANALEEASTQPEILRAQLEVAKVEASLAKEAEARLRDQLQKVQGATAANVDLLSSLDEQNDKLETRVGYLERILVVSGAENEMTTSIALNSLPDCAQPCKVTFETSGPRTLGETKLWLGFVRNDGTAAGFYRLGDWQEINSFVGTGILVLRLASWVRPDAERSVATKIATEEIILSFRPMRKDPHLIKIALAEDGAVLAKAGILGSMETTWRRVIKLTLDPNVKKMSYASPYDLVDATPSFKGPDVGAAITRLRLRVRDLPSEGAMGPWRTIDWGSKSLQDADLEAIAALGAHGCLDNVENLKLDRNRIADSGMISFSRASSAGAFAKLEHLDLSDNSIAADGIKAFSEACTAGAFARIQTLHLYGQKLEDVAMGHLCKALSLGGPYGSLMSCVVILGLHNNAIADEGAVALAHVVLRGALSTTREVYLHGNAIGERGMRELAESLGKGALATIQKLTLYNNIASDTPVLAVLKKRAADGDARKVKLLALEMDHAGRQAKSAAYLK